MGQVGRQRPHMIEDYRRWSALRQELYFESANYAHHFQAAECRYLQSSSLRPLVR
jgi:hypothetical protein